MKHAFMLVAVLGAITTSATLQAAQTLDQRLALGGFGFLVGCSKNGRPVIKIGVEYRF